MSKIQADAARRRWSGTTVDDRREATRPALEAGLERRQRAFKLMGAFEDALESAGLRLVPVDDERADAT